MKYGRVLLADRHLNMLAGVHSLLEETFVSIVMVSDETSLLDAVATGHPDVVVADLSLAGSRENANGNLANRLIRQHPDLRLIIVSIHDEPTVAADIQAAGAAGFVLKRSAAVELIPAIRAVLAGGVYMSPAVQLPIPARR